MGLSLFKPNAKNTGAALLASFNSKGDKKGIFLELIPQTGWNEQTKNGSFKGGEKITVKFSPQEAAKFIHSLEYLKPFEKPLFHKTASGETTTINFVVWKDVFFALSVNKTDRKVGILLSEDEQILFREWLKFALSHIFTAWYSEDVAKAKEYAQSKDEGGDKPAYKKSGFQKKVSDFVEEEKAVEVEDDDIPF
jgi:hypothetical protein